MTSLFGSMLLREGMSIASWAQLETLEESRRARVGDTSNNVPRVSDAGLFHYVFSIVRIQYRYFSGFRHAFIPS